MANKFTEHSGEGVAMERGAGLKMFAWGPTVPADGTAGFGIGCIFIDTTGGAGVTLYVNESTTAACDFNAK
jgi:hypothetical protein